MPKRSTWRGAHQHRVGDGLGRGIGLHMRIGEEDDAARGDHQAHGREFAHARRQPDDVADVAQLGAVAAFEPADHRVRLAAPHGDGGDHRGRGAHQRARRIGRDAAPARDLDIASRHSRGSADRPPG